MTVLDEISWLRDINRETASRGLGRNKLRTYRLFKTEFKTESYLYCPMTKTHRRSFSKFRCGVAPLRLETGRYEGLSESERTCFNCDGIIENEEHVLLECPLYEDIRQTLPYEPLHSDLSNEEKLITMFSSTSFTEIRIVAKICHDILMRRRDIYTNIEPFYTCTYVCMILPYSLS